MSTINFALSKYIIDREDDGLFGNGVDLYNCWLVSTENSNSGGSTEVHQGLKKGIHGLKNQALWAVDTTVGRFAIASLYLFESDKTTSQVKKSFQGLQVPRLSDYSIADTEYVFARIGEGSVTRGIVAPIWRVVGDLVSGRKAIDTDDMYGNWVLASAGFAEKCTIQVMQPVRSSDRVISNSTTDFSYAGENVIDKTVRIPGLAGKTAFHYKIDSLSGNIVDSSGFQVVARLAFDDPENYIEMVLKAKATR